MLNLQIQSQTTYDFLSRPGLILASEHINFVDGTFNNTYRFVGDTVLCGENLLIYQRASSSLLKILLRVEGGKVWRKNYNNPCNDEVLIYEFDLEVGDTTEAYTFNGYYVVDIGTITLLNGEERKKLILTRSTNSTPIEWVDGIGSLEGGLFPIPDFEGYTSLVCVKEPDQTIWLNPGQSTELCDSIACFNPIPDFNFEIDLFQVNFENLSLNQSSVYWDFGDGETSSELHPIHNYEQPGCYYVTLTLGSDCLTRTFEKVLAVPICVAQEWQVKTPDLTNSSIKIDFVNESLGWAIDSKKIWKTEDRGISWTEQYYPIPPSPIDRVLTSIDMVDEMHGVISAVNYHAPSSIEALLVTNNGGLTWLEKMPGSYLVLSAIMTDDGQVFGSGQFNGVFYSNDWGNSFVELSSGGTDMSRFQYLGNNQVVALGLTGLPPNATRTISYSNNSGQSWTHNNLPGSFHLASGFHYFNANEGFVCGYPGFLIKTEDGGQNWEEIAYNDDRRATNIYFVDEQTGWAVGEGGLILSTSDGGNTWLVGNCGYRNNLFSISALDAENCWVSSVSGKYLELNPDAEVDCLSLNIIEQNTSDTALSVFPNPASGEVTISLEKSRLIDSNNRLFIFNNLGQYIYESSLMNETIALDTDSWHPGIYWVLWFQNGLLSGTRKLIVLD